MIKIKSKEDIQGMRRAGKLAAKLLDFLTPHIQAGISTEAINDLAESWTRDHGAISAPLGYKGFPKSLCTSVNDTVCHGIPSPHEILKNGDIVNVDVTVKVQGYHGDHSRMFAIGEVSDDAMLLIERTKKAMMVGIEAVKPGGYTGDIGVAIEKYIRKFGYGIVKDFGGHGIGTVFHEDPFIAHFDTGYKGDRLVPGMIFTVEPMINLGKSDLYIEDDDWTAKTDDGSLSAQWEHTVLVTDRGVEILTISS